MGAYPMAVEEYPYFVACDTCGSQYGVVLESGEAQCLKCWMNEHDVVPEPVVISGYERPIYDCTTGRALPGHPGLA